MGRPKKSGLDYFPLDVNMDEEMELIEAEHGLSGFAIVIKLWQQIYKKGYYTKWDDDSLLLFSRKVSSEVTMVSSVVNSCLLRGIFDKLLYKRYNILTSKGIQERYLTACKISKRSDIKVISEFMLVSSEFKSVISEETPVNSEFSAQSKVKERKGKESKGKERERKEEETRTSPKMEFRGQREFLDMSLNFHKRQKINGYHHVDFKNGITEKSKIVISGAETLQKLSDIDGESFEDIKAVLDFILKDTDFWRDQVISLSGLRGKKGKDGNYKYFTIKNKMLTSKKRPGADIFERALKEAEEMERAEEANGNG